MPTADEAPLVAVALPPTGLAPVAVAAWERGEAVLPLGPYVPAAEQARVLEALAPTHVLDGDGRLARRGGRPVRAGVAAVVATSGTTGEPKGVELTRDSLVAAARAYSAGLGVGARDRWLGCLPTHHVAGLATIARGWATGVPYALHDRFDVAAVGTSPATEGTTVVLVVPTMLHRLLEAGAPVGDFRRVVVGAGPLAPSLRARAEAAGATIVHTYGMTEAWGGVALDGRPIVGAELRIAADEVDPGGGAGEILVRGPMLMARYRFRPELTAAALTADGWFRTGDVGEIVDGVLRVTDRTKDLVKTGGVSVRPTEVEHVLVAHPAVAEVCVVGAPDEEWGERVVACVVPADPAAPPTLEGLRSFARERIEAAKLPRELRVVDSIPRSGSGKPLRRLLRAP